MKFTVNKSDFLNKLTPAMGTVSNKNTITAIEGVLLETKDNNTVEISTYDMNKGFKASVPVVSIERDGKYIINAQRLFQTVKVLPDGDITFDINEKLNCEITCGRAEFSMFALNGTDFPNLPELVTERGFTVSAEVLKEMIGKVQHSIAESDNRPMLCGAFFKINGNRMEVVSCDSYTLSRCIKNCEMGSLSSSADVNYEFIIPGHALSELSKILSDGDDDKVKFYLSRKHAIIRKNDVIFFTRIIDSEYIDYTRIMPRENDINIIVDKEKLLSGLERANIIAEEKIQGSGRSYVKVKVEDQTLSLSSASANGEVSDEMECEHEGNDIEIGFNCRYLINSVRVSEGEKIKITMKSPNQAITIEPEEANDDFSYFYMILPVRMNEQ